MPHTSSHSPWLTVWTRPRQTISHIIKENPNKGLWILAFLYGFCSLLNLFQSAALGKSLSTPLLLVLAIVIAPFWGYLNFFIWSWVVTIVGKWFKGEGTFTTIRSSYVWSCVPIALNVPLWILLIALFGSQLFLNFPDSYTYPSGKIIALFIISMLKVTLAIWSLVIYLNMLAEVQKYSILRSILNVLVAAILLMVVFFIIWKLLVLSLGGV